MRWYVRTADGKAVGPLEGEAVRLALAQGVKLIEVAPEDSQVWLPVDSVPAFAVALSEGRPAAPLPQSRRVVLPIVAVGGVLVVGAFAFIGWLSVEHPIVSTKPVGAAPSGTPYRIGEDDEPAKPPSVGQRMAAAGDLSTAVRIALPVMGDTANKPSDGALLLTAWATLHPVSDFFVAEDETSIARVLKDSDDERGKRLCSTGSIIEIASDRLDTGKFYVGILMARGMNLVRFFAVGSTGALVQGSDARVCGVITGKFDYSNSAGGVGHSVQLVGMFDLPDNRGVTVVRERPNGLPKKNESGLPPPAVHADCIAKCWADHHLVNEATDCVRGCQ